MDEETDRQTDRMSTVSRHTVRVTTVMLGAGSSIYGTAEVNGSSIASHTHKTRVGHGEPCCCNGSSPVGKKVGTGEAAGLSRSGTAYVVAMNTVEYSRVVLSS